MNAGDFQVRDIFRHRVLGALHGGADHGQVVFTVTRALEKADDYETRVWGAVVPHGKPGALTSAAHGASRPRLSRDGRTLGFLSERGKDGRQLHLLRLDGGEARKVTHAKRLKLASIEDWSTDGRRLLLRAGVPCQEGGEEPPRSRQRRPQVARYLPYKKDGSGVVTGSRTHLFSTDIRHGELTPLTDGDFDVSFAAWSPDGDRLAFVRNRSERQRHRDDVWVAHHDGGNPRRLVAQFSSISHLAWSPDGKNLGVMAIEEEGDSFVALWLVEVDSGHVHRLGDADFEVQPGSGVHWNRDGSRIAVITAHHGLQMLATVSVPEGLVQRFRTGLRSLGALTVCGRERLAYISSSMRWGAELRSIQWDGTDERRHTGLNRRWMRERDRPRVTRKRFKVPDGEGGDELIDGWLLRPRGSGPFPLLVDFHGGPHSMVLTDFAAHTYWYLLVSRGWAVLAANAVGSGGYGPAFARRLRGRWGELDLPQHLAAISALQRDGVVDHRVACIGKSYGGYLSGWALGQTDVFLAAISCAPVANLASHFGTSDTGYYTIPYLMGAELPDATDLYQRLSPVSHCARATAATLILQGETDGRCPRGQGEELFSHLIRYTNVPVELVIYPGSSHAEAESGQPGNRVDYHQRVVRWIERWVRHDPSRRG